MSCNISCVPLFPSSILTLNVEDEFSNLLKLKEYEYLENSCGNLCYSTNSIQILDDFPAEKEKLQSYFDLIKDSVLRYKDTQFKITTSWGTKCEPMGGSQYHQHRNCMYTAVLYYDECDNVGNLEFENFDKKGSFEVKPDSYNIHNSTEWKIHPVKNLLVIFPSYLYHRIGCNPDQTYDRYSLALNFHPYGQYGDSDSTFIQ